jgi:hypothetical protein
VGGRYNNTVQPGRPAHRQHVLQEATAGRSSYFLVGTTISIGWIAIQLRSYWCTTTKDRENEEKAEKDVEGLHFICHGVRLNALGDSDAAISDAFDISFKSAMKISDTLCADFFSLRLTQTTCCVRIFGVHKRNLFSYWILRARIGAG